MGDEESTIRSTVGMVDVGSMRFALRDTGEGVPVLLLHGFPHTKEVWHPVEKTLASGGLRVLSPDLRGVGDSDLPLDGFEAFHQAAELGRLLDSLSITTAHVVGFDVGAAPAFALAAAHPHRVTTLTLVEALIPGIGEAGSAFNGGEPWWFGFHRAQGGLAEEVVAGSADQYVRFFLDIGSRRGVPEEMTQVFVRAYQSRGRLRGAFDHYRAMPANANWNHSWAKTQRLKMPVTAVGASTVGDALGDQLATIADDLDRALLPLSGHIVPVDDPVALANVIISTVARAGAQAAQTQ